MDEKDQRKARRVWWMRLEGLEEDRKARPAGAAKGTPMTPLPIKYLLRYLRGEDYSVCNSILFRSQCVLLSLGIVSRYATKADRD